MMMHHHTKLGCRKAERFISSGEEKQQQQQQSKTGGVLEGHTDMVIPVTPPELCYGGYDNKRVVMISRPTTQSQYQPLMFVRRAVSDSVLSASH